MSEAALTARLHAIGSDLASRAPAVLAAMSTLLEAVLATADRHLRIERTPTAPVVLTAEQVLEAARGRGVPALGAATDGAIGGAADGTADGATNGATDRSTGDRLILLASLGLDLTDPAIRAALVDLHRRGELQLVPIGDLAAARAGLAARGHSTDLVEASALGDSDTTYHAVAIP